MESASGSARSARDLLTVDLRGIKPLLMSRAQARRVSVSALVRQALNDSIQDGGLASFSDGGLRHSDAASDRVRISLRLKRPDADELIARAAKAGLPLGEHVVELMRYGIDPMPGSLYAAQIAALSRSNAELSTLSRNVARLTALLKQGDVQAALFYRDLFDRLNSDVRGHLAVVSRALAGSSHRRRAGKQEVNHV